jgi:hypothetical protein
MSRHIDILNSVCWNWISNISSILVDGNFILPVGSVKQLDINLELLYLSDSLSLPIFNPLLNLTLYSEFEMCHQLSATTQV